MGTDGLQMTPESIRQQEWLKPEKDVGSREPPRYGLWFQRFWKRFAVLVNFHCQLDTA